MFHEGAGTYMMSKVGGEGTQKRDEVSEASKGGCVKMQTGREEVKISDNFADVICKCPLIALSVY